MNTERKQTNHFEAWGQIMFTKAGLKLKENN